MKQPWQTLSAWWDGLSARDRRMVMLGAACALPLLGYLLVWEPIDKARDAARQAEEAMAEQLDEARRLAASVRARAQTAGMPAPAKRVAPLPAIEAAARDFALSAALKRREAEGANGVRIVLEAAPAEALLRMLEALELKQGLHVTQAQIDPASPGRVNAQISLKSDVP